MPYTIDCFKARPCDHIQPSWRYGFRELHVTSWIHWLFPYLRKIFNTKPNQKKQWLSCTFQGCALRARLPTIGWCGRRQQKQRWLVEHLPEVYAEVMILEVHKRKGVKRLVDGGKLFSSIKHSLSQAWTCAYGSWLEFLSSVCVSVSLWLMMCRPRCQVYIDVTNIRQAAKPTPTFVSTPNGC